MMLHRIRDADHEQELLGAFKVFDQNGDGFISAEELQQAMASIGETITTREINEMMSEVDHDRDGRISCKKWRNKPQRVRDTHTDIHDKTMNLPN